MSGSGWQGPTDQWAQHSRPLAEKALKRVRADGWYCRKANAGAKVWGQITCGDPATVPPHQRCGTYVSSTSGPKDGSETAKVIDEYHRKCTHPRPEPVVASGSSKIMARAEGLVASAEDCVTAAERLQDANGHNDLVEDFLERASEQAADAEVLLAQAEAADEAAAQANRDADAAAQRAGVSASLGSRDLADRAYRRVVEAEDALRGTSGPAATSVRARCDAVRARVSRLIDDSKG